MLARGWLLVIPMMMGCAMFGDTIELVCIKGQLSEAQAAAIKPEEYETWPSYCAGREDDDGKNGNADCQPRKYDRILDAECSDALSRLEPK